MLNDSNKTTVLYVLTIIVWGLFVFFMLQKTKKERLYWGILLCVIIIYSYTFEYVYAKMTAI